MKKSPLFFACLPLLAFADDGRYMPAMPPEYLAECGSCHVPFPARRMTAEDWQAVMRALDKHYGENASLDEKMRVKIENYLVENAGSEWKLGRGGNARPGEPPRMTLSAWFKRKHRKVSDADWRHPKVKSPVNCSACHTRAEQGSYSEREIVTPTGRLRRGDDD